MYFCHRCHVDKPKQSLFSIVNFDTLLKIMPEDVSICRTVHKKDGNGDLE